MHTQPDCPIVDFNEILNSAYTIIYSLTTEQREALDTFLTTTTKIVILDTDLQTLFSWNGSIWVPVTNEKKSETNIFVGTTNGNGELTVPHTLGTANFALSVLQENSWYPISVTAKTATDFTLVVYDTAYSFPQLFTPITLSWTATAITV